MLLPMSTIVFVDMYCVANLVAETRTIMGSFPRNFRTFLEELGVLDTILLFPTETQLLSN